MNSPRQEAVPASKDPNMGAKRVEPIRVADFFCGCGGTSAGLRAAGMDIRFGLDIDAEASATYRRNFPDAEFLEGDVAGLDPSTVAALIGEGGGPLLVAACAPCQPYSTFASGSPRDGRRTLLLRLVPILEELQPDYVLIENVPGLREPAPASTFNRFCKALARLGFDTTTAVVDCRDYGVPQRRRRLVLIASRHGAVELPAPTHGFADGLLPSATVNDWIGDFPPINSGDVHPTVPNHQASALSPLNLRRIRATPEGGNRDDWPDELQLVCHKNHSGHSDVYGRLRRDGQAPVLTTKCTSLSNGRYGHPTQDRPISVREAASLQTFPTDFVFVGGIKSATRQVGNAVPVLLSQRMGEAIVRHWSRTDENATRGNGVS